LAVDTPVALIDDFSYANGSFFWIINNIFFQYYSLVIFLVCIAVMVGVSYMTAEPDYAKISGLTYGTLTKEHRDESRSSWNWRDVAWSALVMVLIISAYLYFTG
jgi:SSS family solute:Na+ symporter